LCALPGSLLLLSCIRYRIDLGREWGIGICILGEGSAGGAIIKEVV